MNNLTEAFRNSTGSSCCIQLLHLVLFVFIFSACVSQAEENPQRPNILFLMADDHRADAMGFMGNTYIITPNLDSLASKSVVFENAYHVAPICMPSRASVMTGQYLSTHRSGFDYPTNYTITDEEFQKSYPAVLRENGYFTGFIGKFGFAVSEGEKVTNHGLENKMEYMPFLYFDIWNGFPGQGSYYPKKGKFNGYENVWEASHLTEFIGYQAIDFLNQAQESGKPFCLSVSFKAPHAPFSPAEEFRAQYNGIEVPRMVNDNPEAYQLLPEVVKEKSRNARWYFGRTVNYHGKKLGYRKSWHIEEDTIYQEFIKNYYALISGVDHTVGRIRKELEKLGLADNTIIIYTADNGFFAGSRQLMGKALLYEESAKAPMIIYDPTVSKKEGGIREDALISHIDIAPTILDMAGLNQYDYLPGESILPLVRQEAEAIHKAVYGENNYDENNPISAEVEDPEQYQSIRSKYVRTKEYKFIRYHENHPVTEELYRISDDPLEENNLIDDTEHAQTAEEMRALLDAFVSEFVKEASKGKLTN